MIRWGMVLVLLSACGDDAADDGGDSDGEDSGDTDPAIDPPTLDELYGTWVERTGNTYRAFELRKGNLLFADGPTFRLNAGPVDHDPTMQSPTWSVLQARNYLNMYQDAVTSAYDVRIDAFSGDTMTTAEGEPGAALVVHRYVREPACPLERDGVWMWSRFQSGGFGQLDLALGPHGPALAMGGENDRRGGGPTFVERRGCGFTSTVLPRAGFNYPRIAFGPDGQPRIAATFASLDISHLRINPTPTSNTGFEETHLTAETGRPFDLAVDAAGATWVSHSAGSGLSVSKIELDGTTTTTEVYPALAQSVLALDADGNPHVVFEPNTDYLIYGASLENGTWTVSSTPIVPGIGRNVTGLAIGADGSLHLGWTEYLNTSEEHARYSTNASGTWTTTILGPGRHPDVALDSQDHPHVIYEGIPDRKPHLATNASGTWVDIIPQSADSPPPDAVIPDTGYSLCAIAIDENDKIYVAFGEANFGTDAY